MHLGKLLGSFGIKGGFGGQLHIHVDVPWLRGILRNAGAPGLPGVRATDTRESHMTIILRGLILALIRIVLLRGLLT